MRTAFLVVAAFLAAPASAQVYKCVDSAGKTVYAQVPCPTGQAAKTLSSAPKPAAEATEAKPGAKPPPDPEQEFRKRQAERAEADKKSAEEQTKTKERQEACSRAREAVAQFDVGGRYAGVDAKTGEKYFYDDNRIAQEKARAQQMVSEYCR